MENHPQSLKKRLYQNLLVKANKPTYLLESQAKSNRNNQLSKSQGTLQPLKPKIIQQFAGEVNGSPPLSKSKNYINETLLPKNLSKSKLANKKPQQQLIINQGKILLSPKSSSKQHPNSNGSFYQGSSEQAYNITKKSIKPDQVEKTKLSKEGKAVIQQGKLRAKDNLKPHDIFMFYESFPQMKEDFFYLNKVSHPYDYQVVPYTQRNQGNYMTISSQGVTLYHDKEVDFVSKEQWLKDQKMYYKLQKISFFQQYKISKNFLIWKNKMKRHYMKQMSNVLQERLFLTYKYPRKCLLQIKKLTNMIKQSLYFLPTDSLEPLTHQAFLEQSHKFQQNCLIKALKQIQEQIISNLNSAINEEINKFKQDNNIKIDGLDTSAQLSVSKVEKAVQETLGKSKKVEQNEQQAAKQPTKEVARIYSQQAILRKQYKRIAKLIKLVDNNLVESKIQLIRKCLEQLLEKLTEIHNEDVRQQWIICKAHPIIQQNTRLSFQSQKSDQSRVTGMNRIRWEPSLPQLQSTFKNIIENSVRDIACKATRVIDNQIFHKYRATEDVEVKKEEKYHNLRNLIESSDFYHQIIKEIMQIVEKEFSRTKEEEAELMNFIEIYTKHTGYDMKEIFENMTISEISQLVRQWREDNASIQLLSQRKNRGLLIFDYSLLRKKIINAPRESLSSFFSMLPGQVSRRCSQVSSKAKSLLEGINTYPTDIISFVEFTHNVKKASDELQDRAISEGKQLTQMITLMEQNRLQNVQIFKGRVKEVISIINHLKVKVQESNAKFDHSLSKFKKDLEITIQRIKTNTKQLIGKFHNIQIQEIGNGVLTPESQDRLIDKLKQLIPSINSLDDQSQNINQIQQQLSLPITDFSCVGQLHRKFHLTFTLWQCKQQWTNLLVQTYKKHFTKIDCLQADNEWQKFNSKSNRLLKELTQLQGEQNQIAKRLVLQVVQFQSLLQCIKSLQNSNLDQKGWKQISEYLAFELNQQENLQKLEALPFANRNDSKYTVEWFIANNLPAFKQKFEFIVKKSEKQKELAIVLQDIKAYLQNFTLETVVDKRQTILLADNDQTLQTLKQNLVKLQSILLVNGNEYSQVIRREAETLIKQYEYLEEILYSFQQFRKNWDTYQSFFEVNSHSLKILTKQGKQFSSWEIQWKKIAKQIVSESFHKKIVDQTFGSNPSRSFLKQINKVNVIFDQIKKGVDQYLERKRISFSRYYFYSDEQLLDILKEVNYQNNQQTSLGIPSSVQQNKSGALESKIGTAQNSHNTSAVFQIIPKILISKLYENISQIFYDRESIIGFRSKDDEKIAMKPIPLKAQSEVQQNLKVFDQHLKKTINGNIKSALSAYSQEQVSREKMIFSNTTQVVLAVDHIAWVRLAQQTYLSAQPIGDLYDWIQIQETQIRQLFNILNNCSLNNDSQFRKTCKMMAKINTRKIQQLLSQSIYFREKTESLLKAGISSVSSYQWERSVKMYMTMNHSYASMQIYLKQLSAYKIPYCSQFLGNNLVSFITTEREKSWIKIGQALANRESASLTNNDSTKETLGDLAYLIAQKTKYYNLPQILNTKALQRLISGICLNGNWAFINETESSQVMRFFAVHLSHIQKVLQQNEAGPYSIVINKMSVNVNPNMAVFFNQKQSSRTLNNLSTPFAQINLNERNLYRNIYLQRPDNEKILQIISQSHGLDPDVGSKILKVLNFVNQILNGQGDSVHSGNILNRKPYQQLNTLKMGRAVLSQFQRKNENKFERAKQKQKSINLLAQNNRNLQKQINKHNPNLIKEKKQVLVKLQEQERQKIEQKLDEKVIQSIKNVIEPLVFPEHKSLFLATLNSLNPGQHDKTSKGILNPGPQNNSISTKILKTSKKIILSRQEFSQYDHVREQTFNLVERQITAKGLAWLDNDLFKCNAALLYELLNNQQKNDDQTKLQCDKVFESVSNGKGIIVCGEILCGKTQLIDFVIGLCQKEACEENIESDADQCLTKIQEKVDEQNRQVRKGKTVLIRNSNRVRKATRNVTESSEQNSSSIQIAYRKKSQKVRTYAKQYTLFEPESTNSIQKLESSENLVTSRVDISRPQTNRSKNINQQKIQQQDDDEIKVTPVRQKNFFKLYHNAYNYQDIYGNQINMKTAFSSISYLNQNGRSANGFPGTVSNMTSNINFQKGQISFQQRNSIMLSNQNRNQFENTGIIQNSQNQNNNANVNTQIEKPQLFNQGIIAKNLKSNGRFLDIYEGPQYNWLIFDGQVSKNYASLFANNHQNIMLSNSSLLGYNSNESKTKVLLETTRLSQLDPVLVIDNHIIHIRSQSCTIQSIVASYAQKQTFKQSSLSKTTLSYLFSQLQYGIKKLGAYVPQSANSPYQSFVLGNSNVQQSKNKGIDFVYPISHFDLAHKVLKLVEAIFTINKANIKQKQDSFNLISTYNGIENKSGASGNFKNNKESQNNNMFKRGNTVQFEGTSIPVINPVMRRIIEKFVVWSFVWSLDWLVNKELSSNQCKFQKLIMEIFKSFQSSCSSFNNCSIKRFMIGWNTNNGLQLQYIGNGRTLLTNIPEQGIVTTLVNREKNIMNCVQHGSFSLVQNKNFEQICPEQPNSIRVNTEESAQFSYMYQVNSTVKRPVLILGEPGTGKKSLVELFVKNNQSNVDLYSIRLPMKRDTCRQLDAGSQFLAQKLENSQFFRKFNGISGNVIKPNTSSHKLTIMIQDLSMHSNSSSQLEFLRMFINQNGMFLPCYQNNFYNPYHSPPHNLNGSSSNHSTQNNGGSYAIPNKPYEWINFSLTDMCLISHTIPNDNCDVVNRFLSRVSIFQTDNNSKDKIFSIFAPMVKEWAINSGISQSGTNDLARIFNINDEITNRNKNVQDAMDNSSKQNSGQSMIDATINIYSHLSYLVGSITQIDNESIFSKILLRPNLADINKILNNVFRVVDPNSRSLSFYAQLWVHQALRTFADRMPSNSPHLQPLIKQIKKESLLKFKENINMPITQDSFIFTTLSIPQESYQKIQDPESELYGFINTLLESNQLSLPLFNLFPELLNQILRIHRILQLDEGHLMIFGVGTKVRNYLVQLGCQIASNKYQNLTNAKRTKSNIKALNRPEHQNNQMLVDLEKHILPAILNDYVCCFQIELAMLTDSGQQQTLDHRKLYQIACLMGKNAYDKFEFKPDIKEKLKAHFIRTLKANLSNEQKQGAVSNNGSIQGQKIHFKSQFGNNHYKPSQTEQMLMLNQKVEEQYENLTIERFNSSSHFVFTADPTDSKTRAFLQLYPSICKKLHYSWYEHEQLVKENTLYRVAQHSLTHDYLQNEELDNQSQRLSKQQISRIVQCCDIVFKQQKDSNFNNLFILVNNVSCDYLEKRNKICQKISNFQGTLAKMIKSRQNVANKNKLTEQIHGNVQKLKKRQQQLSKEFQRYSSRLSEIQMQGGADPINSQYDKSQKSQQSPNQYFEISKKLEKVEGQLKQIKIEKQSLDQLIRQARRSLSISNDIIKMLDSQQKIIIDLQNSREQQKDLIGRVVLTWSVLIYLGNKDPATCLRMFKTWQYALSVQSSSEQSLLSHRSVSSIQGILNILSTVIPYHQCKNIDGLQRFSPEIVLKAVILLFNLSVCESSIYSSKLLTIYDPQNILCKVLRSLSQGSSYGQMKLINQFNATSANCMVNGQIDRALNKYKNGTIIVFEQINKNAQMTNVQNNSQQNYVSRTFKNLNQNFASSHSLSYKNKNSNLYDDLHALLTRKMQQHIATSNEISKNPGNSTLNISQERINLQRVNRVFICSNYFDQEVTDFRIQTVNQTYPRRCLELTSISIDQPQRIEQIKSIHRQLFKDSVRLQQTQQQFFAIFGKGRKLQLITQSEGTQNIDITMNKGRNDIIEQGIEEAKKLKKSIQIYTNNLQRNTNELSHPRFRLQDNYQDLIQILTELYVSLKHDSSHLKQALDLKLTKQLYKQFKIQEKACFQQQKNKARRAEQKIILKKQRSQSNKSSNEPMEENQTLEQIGCTEQEYPQDLEANKNRLEFLKSVFIKLRINILGMLPKTHQIVRKLRQICITGYLKRVFTEQELSNGRFNVLKQYLNEQFSLLQQNSFEELFQQVKFWGNKIPIILMPNNVKSRETLSKTFKGQVKILNLMSIQSLTQLNIEQNETIQANNWCQNSIVIAKSQKKNDQLQQLTKLKALQLPETMYQQQMEEKSLYLPFASSVKCFVNYNDNLHFEMITQLCEKYQNDYKQVQQSKQTFVVLLVNQNQKDISMRNYRLINNLAFGNLPGNQFFGGSSCCRIILPQAYSLQNEENRYFCDNESIENMTKITEKLMQLFSQSKHSQSESKRGLQIGDPQKKPNIFLKVVREYVLIKQLLYRQQTLRQSILKERAMEINLSKISFQTENTYQGRAYKPNLHRIKQQLMRIGEAVQCLTTQKNIIQNSQDLIQFFLDYQSSQSVSFQLISQLAHQNCITTKQEHCNPPQFAAERIKQYLVESNQELQSIMQKYISKRSKKYQLKFDQFGQYVQYDIFDPNCSISQEKIKQVLQELPFAFNFSQMTHNSNTTSDPCTFYVLERCYNLNKRLKMIKKHIKQTLNEVKANRSTMNLLAIKLPSDRYIQNLSRQYSDLKRIIIHLGLIQSTVAGTSSNLKTNNVYSVNQNTGRQHQQGNSNLDSHIVRGGHKQPTWAVNASSLSGPFPTQSILANSLNIQDIGFTNQFKQIWHLKISRKVKAALGKVAMNWIIHPQQFFDQLYANHQQQSNVNNIIPNMTNPSEIFLVVRGLLINGRNLAIGQNSAIQNFVDLQNQDKDIQIKVKTGKIYFEKQKSTVQKFVKRISLVLYPSIQLLNHENSQPTGKNSAQIVKKSRNQSERNNHKKNTLTSNNNKSIKQKNVVKKPKYATKVIHKKQSEQTLIIETIPVPIIDRSSGKILGKVEVPLLNNCPMNAQFIRIIDQPYFLV